MHFFFTCKTMCIYFFYLFAKVNLSFKVSWYYYISAAGGSAVRILFSFESLGWWQEPQLQISSSIRDREHRALCLVVIDGAITKEFLVCIRNWVAGNENASCNFIKSQGRLRARNMSPQQKSIKVFVVHQDRYDDVPF